CVAVKKRYVENDELDKGMRMHLNLGHTLGHALEKLSNYTLLHGFAVAKGIALIAKLSRARGMLNNTDYQRIIDILNKYGYDLTCPYETDELLNIINIDKKVINGAINLILIRTIGEVVTEKIILKNLEDCLSVCCD
ncbi:MAG: 3-dehydroquinate synthase, partial [Clostridia bacterium]|nr:3-dehydroquinate synthase [Clostridia bacterium]